MSADAETLWHALARGDTREVAKHLHQLPVRTERNRLDRCYACEAESTDTIYINGIAYGVCERC